jgi:hypothetical protein
MKDKFIRVLSPFAIPFMLILDCAVLYFAYFAVSKIITQPGTYSYIFGGMELFAIAVAVLVSKEMLSQGVKFGETQLEVTSLDADNKITYSEVKAFETRRDTRPSLIKGFNDRESMLVFELSDGERKELSVGLTTKKKLEELETEIKSRISK